MRYFYQWLKYYYSVYFRFMKQTAAILEFYFRFRSWPFYHHHFASAYRISSKSDNSPAAELRSHIDFIHGALKNSLRTAASGFQDIHPCLSFVRWHRSCVSSWWKYAGYRRWPPSSVVCWQSNMLGQELMQPVRWRLFCHRRANAVEQSAWTASATGHDLRTIQTIVENVCVWLVMPRRLVSER